MMKNIESAADLHVMRVPGENESVLLARSATEATLLATGGIEGELVGRETVASARLEDGQRCVDIDSVMIEHDPGLLAERQALELVVRAADHTVLAAEQGCLEHYRTAAAALAGVMPHGAIPADAQAALLRISSSTISDAIGSGVSPSDEAALIQAVSEADTSTAAADVIAPAAQRIRQEVARVVRQRDSLFGQGRVDAAHGMERALRTWADETAGALGHLSQRSTEEAENQLAAANQYLVTQPDFDEVEAEPAAASNGLTTWFTGWFFKAGESSPTVPPMDEDLRATLERHLSARLTASAAQGLRAVVLAVSTTRLEKADFDRRLEPVVLARDGAAAAIQMLEERAQERQRRLSGVFLPADSDIRKDLAGMHAATSPAALASRLIGEPLASELSQGGVNQQRFEQKVLVEARTMTNPTRDASLAQAVGQLSDAQVDNLAKILVAVGPRLEFRAGSPPPSVYRRICVPGGSTSRLGQAVRRRAPQIDVAHMDLQSQPLTAFSVACSEVFAVTQLQGFHGEWREAREAGRVQGWAPHLVSDRRYLDLPDGILDDGDIDEVIVRAIAADVLAASKEPPSSTEVGGTWYLIPEGQSERPSQIDPVRLDGVFRGQRLGKSLPEIRRTLRNSPGHRAWVMAQWDRWCEETRPVDRVARLDFVIRGVLLPSDELVSQCRSLKNRQPRQGLTEVA